ncbi:histidine kinase [Asanoa ishikariensis]|uniref:histidine kinase n=1 Tax=Asanoa ishikariensis TaxID=137265 RepID=A0A1H3UGQ7_9ACTN|nr:sensor histidine kinase [Asanoa ishikariensis]GIF63564.1 histidine kinase [Asanoa ishikariensis]SDZ61578.1 Histidine kinase [Asanoa ishikariensis]
MEWEDRIAAAREAGLRGIELAARSLGGLLLFIAAAISIALLPLGIGLVLAPRALAAVRRYADEQRERGRAWSGVRIDRPYRGPAHGLRQLADPATWRDLLWLVLNVPVGTAMGLVPVALTAWAGLGLVIAPVVLTVGTEHQFWPVAVGIGVLAVAVLIAGAPAFLDLHARFSAALLSPPRYALEARVDRLEVTRADALDSGAAELRRIEKDLHDGAQARIAALGMTIGLAEQLIRTDPAKAEALLAEARDTSGQALADLRRLVRGIHPPVLAERGLVEAVRALAVVLPVPTTVFADPGVRAAAPVEAALYFAIAEALANVTKHSGATRAWVNLRARAQNLLVEVGDDGAGGAGIPPAGGLAGVCKRLGAFDGRLAVTSPPGGPTVLAMEVPCGS